MNKHELEEELDKLRKKNCLVIVEGKKDVRCLKALGIDNVFALNGMPLFKVTEEVAKEVAKDNNSKEVVILTDLDKEGKKLFGRLNSWLSYQGVKVDNRFRNYLLKNTKLRQIEGLKSYIDNSKEQI